MKLKRCPFCNSHELTMDVMEAAYQIRCLDCGAAGPWASMGELAIERWNEGQEGSTAMVNMKRKYTNRDDQKEVEM